MVVQGNIKQSKYFDAHNIHEIGEYSVLELILLLSVKMFSQCWCKVIKQTKYFDSHNIQEI